jgi:type III restriction enzyme
MAPDTCARGGSGRSRNRARIPIDKEAAEAIRASLVDQKMLEPDGRLGAAFEPKKKDFKLALPPQYSDLEPAVVDLLAAYQIERHIRKDADEKPNRLKKEIALSADFEALWNHIKPRTTYRVEFETDTLVIRAVDAIKRMEKIEAPKIKVVAGRIELQKGGVAATALSAAEEQPPYRTQPAVPDVLAYLQSETELTRSTLARILKGSGRLGDLLINPQRFMDRAASILKFELHRLLVDGIKYEKISGIGSEAEWQMVLFRNEELVNVLTALQVKKSVYEYIAYESEVEREFAKKLDQREDVRLFVKLPDWFKIETPVGTYNPDWAIVKHHDQTVYLVRETKGSKDFLKLRTTEADKVRCGQRHFEAPGVPFAVATSAEDV